MSKSSQNRRQFLKDTGKAGIALATAPIMGSWNFSTTEFQQQALPYAYNALEPFIDALTMEIHYTKHAATYAKNLADAAIQCWNAIQIKDIAAFGTAFLASFHAQIAMFPNMVDETITPIINKYASKSFGYKLSGAGGGGYLILVANEAIENAIRIKIRRKDRM